MLNKKERRADKEMQLLINNVNKLWRKWQGVSLILTLSDSRTRHPQMPDSLLCRPVSQHGSAHLQNINYFKIKQKIIKEGEI